MSSSKHFAYFFDWFYPDYFKIVHKTLNAFLNDDEMVLAIFRFLGELVNNRCSRLRFDTWNINGLLVFKEAAKVLGAFLHASDCL